MAYTGEEHQRSDHQEGRPPHHPDSGRPPQRVEAPPPPQANQHGGGTGATSFGPEDFPMKEAAPVATAVAEPEPEETEREPNLAQFLTYVLEKNCSDLHLTTGLPPMARLHGELRPIPGFRKLFPKDLQELIYAILTQKQREMFEERLELDVSYSLPGKARFRVNVFQQRDALGTVMRLIPFEIKDTEDLGLPQSVTEFANMRRGLVLVTGITGSGKSTTLAALLDIVNSTRAGPRGGPTPPVLLPYRSSFAPSPSSRSSISNFT